MGKTLVINGADFSEVAIGHIDLPRELSTIAKAWINASGNTGLTDVQKYAIDDFISAICADEENSIFSKIDRLWLPMLSADKAHSLIDYKNNYANAIDLMTQDSKNSFDSYAGFENHGLRISTAPSGNVPMIVVDNDYAFNTQDLTIFQFNTVEYDTIESGAVYLDGIGDKSTVDKIFRQVLTSSSLQNYFLSRSNIVNDTSNGFRLPHLRGVSSNSENLKVLLSNDTLSSHSAVTSENLTGIGILRDDVPYCYSQTSKPIGAYIVGKAMSDEEVITLSTAIDALFDIINS